MRIDIERAGTPGRTEFVKVAVQFFFDPLDAEFDQRDEIKVGVEQFGEILLGIIAIPFLKAMYAKKKPRLVYDDVDM